MSYFSDNRDAARELEKYDVKLPPTVLGWLLARRAGLSTEQRQRIMSQVPKDLKLEAVEEALYFLFALWHRDPANIRHARAGREAGDWAPAPTLPRRMPTRKTFLRTMATLTCWPRKPTMRRTTATTLTPSPLRSLGGSGLSPR